MEDILIINTGGTFNKEYHELNGELIIPKNNKNIEEIILNCFRGNNNLEIVGEIFKDSLDMDDLDRIKLSEICSNTNSNKILIVHGTDTMDISADYLNNCINLSNKTIIFTGAMVPYNIDKQESTSNFSFSLSFLLNTSKTGVFIGMHGLTLPFNKISKDKSKGIFREIMNQ